MYNMIPNICFISHLDERKIAEKYVEAIGEIGLNVITDEFDNSSRPLKRVYEVDAGVYILLISEYAMRSELLRPILTVLLDRITSNVAFLIPLIIGNAPIPTAIQHLSNIKISGEDYIKVSADVKAILEQWTTYFPMQGSLAAQTPSATAAAISDRDHKAVGALSSLGFVSPNFDISDRIELINAVNKFQKGNGIWTTGVWDEITEQKALELLNERPSEFKALENTAEESDIQYWFLKIYGNHWSLASLKTGDEMYFHTTFNSFEKRPDYANFTSVKAADKGFAFDYSSSNAVVFSFEVLQGVHKNSKNEEIISFKLLQFIKPPIDLFKLVNFLPFTNKLAQQELERLFPLSEKLYRAIESLIEERPVPDVVRVFAQSSITNVISDSPAKDIKDELDFEKDVNAFAAIMAYREVKPPLAIGLFGNWGSGKSFFMNKLQSRIEQLQQSGRKEYCKHILHIPFNSWHYSDSNLWASLVTKIFDELHRHIKDQPVQLKDLIKELHSTQKILAEKSIEKKALDDELNKLEKEKNVFDERVEKESAALENLSFPEIAGGIMNNTEVQKDFDKIKEKFSFLKLDELDNIKDKVGELTGFFRKLMASGKIGWTFLTGVNKFFLLLLSIFVAVLTWAVMENYMLFEKGLPWAKKMIAYASVAITGVTTFLTPAFTYVNFAYKRLKSLDRSKDQLTEYAQKKFLNEQRRLQQNIDEAQSKVAEVEDEIALTIAKREKLQRQIDDIFSGKLVLEFIEKKVMDERYINSLGIISWVRKDFEELDRLIEQHKNSQSSTEKEGQKKNLLNLERVVLYIDDLDRCNESIVVKVLEAIHLLLAFPLFVVVVGVDPRWMHKALYGHYNKFLSNPQTGSGFANGDDADISDVGTSATSYDYLEKIFQIPFVLKSMTEAGRHRLIRSQLKAGVEENKPIPDNVEPFISQNASGTTFSILEGIDYGSLIRDNKLPTVSNTQTEQLDIKTTISPSSQNQYLDISELEITFLEKISFLIGNSPRTIKRYLNTYRILRTHEGFQLENDQPSKYYLSAIVLLAVITGVPHDAELFFRELRNAPPADYFSIFISRYIEKNDHCSDKIKVLSALIEKKDDSHIDILNGLRIDTFLLNIELVSRFTFRNV